MPVNAVTHIEPKNPTSELTQQKPASTQQSKLFSTQVETNKSNNKLQNAADHSGLSTLANDDNIDNWHSLMGQTYGYDQGDSDSEAYKQSEAIREMVSNNDWSGLGVDLQQVSKGDLGSEAAFVGGDTTSTSDDQILLNGKPGEASNEAITEELFHAFERKIHPEQKGDTRLVDGQASFTNNKSAATLDEGELGRTLLAQFKESGTVPSLSEGILDTGGITADDTSSVVLNGTSTSLENMDNTIGDTDGNEDGSELVEALEEAIEDLNDPEPEPAAPDPPENIEDPAGTEDVEDAIDEIGDLGPVVPDDPEFPTDPTDNPAGPDGTLQGGNNVWFASEAYVPPAEVPRSYTNNGEAWTKITSSDDANSDKDGDTWTLWRNDLTSELLVANQGTAFGTDWGDVGRDVQSFAQVPIEPTWGMPGGGKEELIKEFFENPGEAIFYDLPTAGDGFVERVNNQKDDVFAAIKAAQADNPLDDNTAVKFVGHSLGASVSQGLGYIYSLNNPDAEVSVEVYNAPKLGNRGMISAYTELKNSDDYNFSSDTYNVGGDLVSTTGLIGVGHVDNDDVHWLPAVSFPGSLANHDVSNWIGAEKIDLERDAANEEAKNAEDELTGGGLHIEDTAAKNEYLMSAQDLTITIDQLDAVLAEPVPVWTNGRRDYSAMEELYKKIADDTEGGLIQFMKELPPDRAMSDGIQDLMGWGARSGNINEGHFLDLAEGGFDAKAFLNNETDSLSTGNSEFWSLVSAETLLTLDGNRLATPLIQGALADKIEYNKGGSEVVYKMNEIGYGTVFAGTTTDEHLTMDQTFLSTLSRTTAFESELATSTINLIDDANVTAVRNVAEQKILSVNDTSIAENLEWGGAIWKDESTGEFGATEPRQGSEFGFNLKPSLDETQELGYVPVGDWHTHGNYTSAEGEITDREHDDTEADVFSPQDLELSEQGERIYGIAGGGPSTFTSYLGTPSLNFLSYDPRDKVNPDDEFAVPTVFHSPEFTAIA